MKYLTVNVLCLPAPQITLQIRFDDRKLINIIGLLHRLVYVSERELSVDSSGGFSFSLALLLNDLRPEIYGLSNASARKLVWDGSRCVR